ncbi:MAG: DUF748 domain-containing protein [Pseudomonadales bacterium]|nr:DUF748 domain-containing protein [Pseudomonadales bacterium]
MRKIIRILAIIYLVYLGLVLLVVTPALYFLPAKYVKDYLGRDLQADFILFNPFTLSLEARNLALPDRDGSPFVSLDSASVNLSLASIWQPGIVFDRVAVLGLLVDIKQGPDGGFNFDDLIPPADPDAPPAEPTEIPGITIDQLEFQARQLMFSSAAREQPYSTHLDNIAFNVQGLSTVLEEGKPYRLEAYGEDGGELHWEGEISIPRGHSEGTLRLVTLHMPQLWRLLEPWVAFEVRSGDLSIGGHYELEWQEQLAYRISAGEISLDSVDIQPKVADAPADTRVSLGNLALSGIALDSDEQHLDIDGLEIAELAVRGWSEGSETSLTRLFAVNLPAGDSPDPAPEEPTDDAGWTAQLKRLQLADSELHWRSEFTDPARLEVLPISASATALTWPLGGDSELSLTLTVNGETSATVDGSLDLGSGSGQLDYKLEALPLPWFNPNLPAPLKAKITSGQFRLAGDMGLAGFAPTQINASGAITAFSGQLEGAEESLTSWETVRWDKLAVDLEQRSVRLEKLSIDNYVGRIHINEDGSINAQNAWEAELATETGEQTDSGATDMEPAQASASGEETPWAVSVPRIHITDSEIDFKDESLPISFRTVIGDINGDIDGLSSQPDSPTKVDIKGSVDGYAPVTLKGTAEPLLTPPALDLALVFKGVDMALLSPYSGTYAGYAIEKGVLDLDLNYGLRDDKLDGRNQIVIHQMELGQKIESDQAADLPLELALALLTDSQGVIDMDIPVSGDVNDPEFSVGSVLWGALVNLITKAVTAPFNLLAGLVDSEEDLQRLNFKSGSAELTDATRGKLDDLSTALSQRPELGLSIVGRLQLDADRERLQKNILGSELVAAGLSPQELADKAPAWEAAINERYREMAGEPGELSVREQYLALVKQVPLPDSALLELAQARAVAVKTYLVNDKGLDPSRAAIGQADLAEDQNLYSGVELALDV